MHLADAFIQSDLHCIQVTVSVYYSCFFIENPTNHSWSEKIAPKELVRNVQALQMM